MEKILRIIGICVLLISLVLLFFAKINVFIASFFAFIGIILLLSDRLKKIKTKLFEIDLHQNNEKNISSEQKNGDIHDGASKVDKIQKNIPSESNLIITEPSTVFFYEKICNAFPGLRDEVVWFTSRKDIIKRLSVLFSGPISFQDAKGYNVMSDPMWWFRGQLDLNIKKFEPLKNKRVLLDIKELKIKKIALCRSRSYYRNFVYIECEPDSPTNLYKYEKNQIRNTADQFGYFDEEYAIFKNYKITRQEYDDGAAIIKGIPQQVGEAKLRVRYLTKYNFIVAAKFSPYNCKKFSLESDKYFNDLLREKISFDLFFEWTKKFQKHDMDN